MLVIVAGVAVWQKPWAPREKPASETKMAFELPEKPSIAVLPFTNMSNDANQNYFADGMTEDLITDLSKIVDRCSAQSNATRRRALSWSRARAKAPRICPERGPNRGRRCREDRSPSPRQGASRLPGA